MTDKPGWAGRYAVPVGVGAVVVAFVWFMFGPTLLGAERWLYLYPWSEPDLALVRWVPVESPQPSMLVHQRYSGGDNGVHRLVAVSRDDGAVLGERIGWGTLELVAVRPDRLWVRQAGALRALDLPDLTARAWLDDVLAGFPELTAPVRRVDFPQGTDAVRITLTDGFLWDLAADLGSVTRLHHDTPLPTTPSVGWSSRTCHTELALGPGRFVSLGTHSHRPALRVADRANAAEAEEIATPFEGFLDGGFLCRTADGRPVVRDDAVFVVHRDGGEAHSDQLVSRVDVPGGLVWSVSLSGIDPRLAASRTVTLVYAEDRGQALVLWARGVASSSGSEGVDAMVALAPESGQIRWLRSF